MKLQFMLFIKTLNKRSLLALVLGVVLSQLSIKAYAQNNPTTNESFAKSSKWQWKLFSSSMSQSKISIYRDTQLIRQYVIDCNLDSQDQDELSDERSQIEKVLSTNNHKGLLLITCIHGAHSKLIEIYDPLLEQVTPVFSQYGAYYAGWEKRNGQLFIFYDQACKSNDNNCQQYERIELAWPAQNEIHNTSTGEDQ